MQPLPDELPFRQRAKELLRGGPFRRYILGSAVSDTGTWMQVMAQGWVLSTLTNSALMLGMVNFAAGIPTLALTMFGGSVADRYDKRMILILTLVLQMALAIALGLVILFGTVQIWHIVLCAALLGVAIAFEMPALTALVPELVKKEQIAAAIAMDRSVFHASRLIGPSTAGILVSVFGAASAFFANATSFLALIVAMLTLPPRTPGTAQEEEQRKSGFMEGIRYVRSEKTILSLIILIALTTTFVYPVVGLMLPLYVKNLLQLGPDKLGYLMAVSGIGSLSGSLGLLTVAPGRRINVITIGAAVVAACVFVMSRSTSFLVTAGAMGILAIGLSMLFGLSNTIVQERTPPALRGRVSAVYGLSFFGLMPIAGLVVTGLSDLIGMRTALMLAAIVYGVTAVWNLRRCEHTPAVATTTPAPAEPEPAPLV